MEKKDLLNNQLFIKKCKEMGLKPDNVFKISEDYIIVETANKRVEAIMDDNFNVLCFNVRHTNYSEFIDDEENKKSEFFHPFEEFSLKDLFILNDMIDDHYNSLGSHITIDGKKVDDDYNSDYVLLLRYIKFLIKQNNNYLKNTHHLSIINPETETQPVYFYMEDLIDTINHGIKEFIDNKYEQVHPEDILEYLGLDSNILLENEDIYREIIALLTVLFKEKGYEYKIHQPIQPIKKGNTNITAKATNLLKIVKARKKINKAFQDHINIKEMVEPKRKTK